MQNNGGEMLMKRAMFYTVAGYLGGSLLSARIFGRLIKNMDVTKNSSDGNPGTANAFCNGGFWCGLLTLCGDILKGFIPVYLYLHGVFDTYSKWGLSCVIAAPVIGHILPVFFSFRGGKGIATTFGCLLGMLPDMLPVWVLAFYFIFFSLIVCISPNYYRTILVYFCTEITMLFLRRKTPTAGGFTLIFIAVILRMWASKEKKENCRVELLWKH